MKRLFAKVFRHRLARFVVVGFSNAALHFTVLNTCFYVLGASKILASLIATIFAVTFSFFLNRDFVFKAEGESAAREALLFALVTLTGMLVIHNITYALFIQVLSGHESRLANAVEFVVGYRPSKDFIDINFATIVGAMAALVWNYNGYRLLVFRQKAAEDNAHEESAKIQD